MYITDPVNEDKLSDVRKMITNDEVDKYNDVIINML